GALRPAGAGPDVRRRDVGPRSRPRADRQTWPALAVVVTPGPPRPASSRTPAPSPPPHPEVLVVPDLSAAAAAAAERIARRCEQAAASRGECAIALSGGETPRALYARLAADPFRRRIPWPRIRVFWGDAAGGAGGRSAAPQDDAHDAHASGPQPRGGNHLPRRRPTEGSSRARRARGPAAAGRCARPGHHAGRWHAGLDRRRRRLRAHPP